MPYKTIVFDELKIPLGDGNSSIVAVASGLHGWFEWVEGRWVCDILEFTIHGTRYSVRIEDDPDFKIFVDAATEYANSFLEPPTKPYKDPNAQYRTHGGRS